MSETPAAALAPDQAHRLAVCSSPPHPLSVNRRVDGISWYRALFSDTLLSAPSASLQPLMTRPSCPPEPRALRFICLAYNHPRPSRLGDTHLVQLDSIH
ncbi:hypothetical protein RSAG8_06054, partial [Rhizoctonia solani AG-8 WAC10335]